MRMQEVCCSGVCCSGVCWGVLRVAPAVQGGSERKCVVCCVLQRSVMCVAAECDLCCSGMHVVLCCCTCVVTSMGWLRLVGSLKS